MENNKTEEKYGKEKKKLKIIGKIFLILGIPCLIGGFITFSMTFFVSPRVDMTPEEWDRASDLAQTLAVIGIGLAAGGGFMLVFGIFGTYVAHMGKISSYVAEEVSPAATKMTGAVVKGVHEGGGIKIQLDDTSKQKIMIKCRNCGALNDEDDVFCSKCGEKL